MDYELEKRSLTYWENEKQDLQIVVKKKKCVAIPFPETMTISQGQLKVYERRSSVGAGASRFAATIAHHPAPEDSVRATKSRKGRMADALALTGDEGRDKLRKAAGRCK